MDLNNLPIRIEYLIFIFISVSSGYSLTLTYEFGVVTGHDIIRYMPYTVMLLSAVIIVLFSRRNLQRTMGILAMAFGISNIFTSIPSLTSTTDTVFAVGLVNIVVGLMLTYNGLIYLLGRSRNINLMFYAAVIMFGLDVLGFIMLARILEIILVLNIYMMYIPEMIVLVLFILMMKSKGVSDKTLLWKFDDAVYGLRSGLLIDPGMTMTRADASDFKESVEAGICVSKDIVCSTGNKLVISADPIVQGMNASVISKDDSSGVGRFCFRIGEIVPNGEMSVCDMVRIYGDDGLFMQILVKDPPQKRHPIKRIKEKLMNRHRTEDIDPNEP